jgi:hypothetical protein
MSVQRQQPRERGIIGLNGYVRMPSGYRAAAVMARGE